MIDLAQLKLTQNIQLSKQYITLLLLHENLLKKKSVAVLMNVLAEWGIVLLLNSSNWYSVQLLRQ